MVNALLAALAIMQGHAAVAVPAGPRSARAAAGEAAPRIDGRLDDAVWRNAEPLAGFVQREPVEGQPATELTEARVLFTPGAFYVGVWAFDRDPAGILAAVSRRDEDVPSDWVGVILDSQLDRRTAYEFAVNAAGVQRDVYRFNDTEFDAGWDAVWEAAVHRDDQGWYAELRIPTSQLRFAAPRPDRIGFNVYRRLHRRQEVQYWAPVPRTGAGMVSAAGLLEGIEGLQPRPPLEIAPYLSSEQTFRPASTTNPLVRGRTGAASVGADIRAGIPGGLTLTAALNPDFGQVEADPAEVNLTAFESFFAERRPFFTEGSDLFRFALTPWTGRGEQLFYSRRIGRTPQLHPDVRGGHLAAPAGATGIAAAAKLTGRLGGGWRLGTLGAITREEYRDGIAGDGEAFRALTEPATAYLVGRVSRDWREGRTVLGLFGSGVRRQLDSVSAGLRSGAAVLGLDLSHRFGRDGFTVRGWLAGSRVTGSTDAILRTQRAAARYFQRPDQGYARVDSAATALDGWTSGFVLGKVSGDWIGQVLTFARSPGFEANDAGFMTWAGRIVASTSLARRWLAPGSLFREASVRVGSWGQWSWAGERLDLGVNGDLRGVFHNRWTASIGYWIGVGGTDIEVLRGGPGLRRTRSVWTSVGLESDPRQAVRVTFNGTFSADAEHPGASLELSPGVIWRPSPRFELSAGPAFGVNTEGTRLLSRLPSAVGEEYIVATLRSATSRLTLRANAAFSRTLTLQVYAEPFVASGEHREIRRVVRPNAVRWQDQFEWFGADQVRSAGGHLELDPDQDGAAEIDLGSPDYTALSFRSNLVLRWEYAAGSTLFLVWQHGRAINRARADFGLSAFGGLAHAPWENVLHLKASYWLDLR